MKSILGIGSPHWLFVSQSVWATIFLWGRNFEDFEITEELSR
jgi:hypothetical protein